MIGYQNVMSCFRYDLFNIHKTNRIDSLYYVLTQFIFNGYFLCD